MKTQFDSLKVGQKFEHPDFKNRLLERVCGNAAGFIPHIGMLVTIEPKETVTLVGEA